MRSFQVLALSLAGLFAFGGSSRAAFINGNFETGDFTGWTTTGVTAVLGNFAGIDPFEGSFQGGAQTNGGVAVGALEAFFGLAAGDIDSVLTTGTATVGAGFQQTITVQTGDLLRFNWNFTTSEGPNDPTFNDGSFVVISNTADLLADTFFVPLNPGGLNLETGYQEFQFIFPFEGTYNVGVGTVNVGDASFNSVILADNFSISTPAPPALLLGLVGVPALAVIRRRRK